MAFNPINIVHNTFVIPIRLYHSHKIWKENRLSVSCDYSYTEKNVSVIMSKLYEGMNE